MKHRAVGRAIGMVAVALGWLAGPAAAEEPVVNAPLVDATDAEGLASLIRGLGYRATVEKDGVGDPMIMSSAGGTDFAIYFYGCTDGADCKWLLFKVGYDLDDGTTGESINAWNAETIFGRAYLDDEADPWLEMSVNMDGGVSRANFEDSFDWWEVILSGFEDHIDF
jgi:hypothetical protein